MHSIVANLRHRKLSANSQEKHWWGAVLNLKGFSFAAIIRYPGAGLSRRTNTKWDLSDFMVLHNLLYCFSMCCVRIHGISFCRGGTVLFVAMCDVRSSLQVPNPRGRSFWNGLASPRPAARRHALKTGVPACSGNLGKACSFHSNHRVPLDADHSAREFRMSDRSH